MAAAPPRSGCAPQRHRPSAAELSPRSSPRRRFLHRTSHSSRPERWNWHPACRCPNLRYLPRYRLSCRWSQLIRASGHSPRGLCPCLYRSWRSRRCPRGTFRPGAAVQALAEARGRGCVTGATAARAAVTAATATQQASGEFVQSATQAVVVVVVVARSAAGFCVRGRRGDGENSESPHEGPRAEHGHHSGARRGTLQLLASPARICSMSPHGEQHAGNLLGGQMSVTY